MAGEGDPVGAATLHGRDSGAACAAAPKAETNGTRCRVGMVVYRVREVRAVREGRPSCVVGGDSPGQSGERRRLALDSPDESARPMRNPAFCGKIQGQILPNRLAVGVNRTGRSGESGDSPQKCSRKQDESPGGLGVRLWITQYLLSELCGRTVGKRNNAVQNAYFE